jgi:hypothetical protein
MQKICTDRNNALTLKYKALSMTDKNEHLDTLHDIKEMMERSSRFISLSGLSGIAAGACALAASIYTWRMMISLKAQGYDYRQMAFETGTELRTQLIRIGCITFMAALAGAFTFTYLRSQSTHVPVWGTAARRLLWNTMIPLVVGAFVVIRLLQAGLGGLIAPTCLLFYGLALINGSKYTLTEIRWLGYCEILLGIINLWMIGYGLILWSIGFGVLHILYGIIMWWKYEKP